MAHLSVFKHSTNSRGYVQCTISDEFIEEFTAMGFVKSVGEVKKPRAKKKVIKDGD